MDKNKRLKLTMTKRLTNKEAQLKIDNKFGEGQYLLLSDYKNNHENLDIKHVSCGNTVSVSLGHLISSDRTCKYCNIGNKKDPIKFKEDFIKKYKGKYQQITEYSSTHEKILVKCLKCSTKFFVEPNSIYNRGTGCPNCAINKKQDTKYFSKLVTEKGGGDYVLCSSYKNNTSPVSIKHLSCGNVYSVTPKDFKNGNRCPVCKSSKGEKLISGILDNLGVYYEKEKSFPDIVPIKQKKKNQYLRYDFFVPDYNLLIEYDGIQHFKPVPYFDKGKEENIKSRKYRDSLKNHYADRNNIILLRIPYYLSFNKVEEIINKIVSFK